MSLILPPHVRVEHRPYRTASTVELMQELHYRDVLHELSGSQAIVRDSHISLDPIRYNEMRKSVLAALLQQMGMVIGQSGRCLLQSELQQQVEVIHAKVIICKHPKLDPDSREEIEWKTADEIRQAEQSAQAQTELIPRSPTSSPYDEE